MAEETTDLPQLYVVFLGGDPAPGRMGEDHEVVAVVASDVKSARAKARAKWTGVSKGHVDAVRVLKVIDGYEIVLQPSSFDEVTELDVTYEPADVNEAS
jgi:hypothetical protein